jgi:nitroreductase
MKVSEAIKIRRSVRKYKKERIPKKIITQLLESARLAPSAGNRQEWKFIVVENEEKRKALALAAGQEFVGEAPVVIVGVALSPNRVMSCGVPAYAVDLGIALTHIVLHGVELGLGSCWIGAFNQEEVKKILEIKEEYKVVALLPIGYPAESPTPRERKGLEEVVSYNRFE